MEKIETIQKELEQLAGLRGLILLGSEGINATVSGGADAISSFKALVNSQFEQPIDYKDSFAEHHPFRDYKIRLRKEIVTLGRPDLVPTSLNGHLSPKEWHDAIQEPDVLVLDTRNAYEVDIGKFKTAIDLQIDEFQEFPERVKAMEIPKDKKILMYCTGGIRCEKAALEMRGQGFNNVFQLQGGILEYLREFPNQEFEGECFVFDYRVAVDQNLEPSKNFRLCPHCGQPASEKIDCYLCDTKAIICTACLTKAAIEATCSKNCAHHVGIKSSSKRPHKQELSKRLPV